MLAGFSMPAFSQEKEQKKDSTALWQGMLVEMDVAPFLQTAIFDQHSYRIQGNVQFILKNKYFPVVEAGVAGISRASDSEVQFQSNGAFAKLGLDIPALKAKEPGMMQNFFLAGFRLGMSHFNYSFNNLSFNDDYWGGSDTFDTGSLSATKFWLELNAGIRVDVFRNIYMGWTIRNKHIINKNKPGAVAPWYIPGYGQEEGSSWGLAYTVGYRF